MAKNVEVARGGRRTVRATPGGIVDDGLACAAC
jgi:hypothetical protein